LSKIRGRQLSSKPLKLRYEAKALMKEPDFAERVRALQTAIAEEPVEHLSAWGIDLGNIHAAGDIIVKNLKAQEGAVRVRDLEARSGRIELSGITAGGQSKN
jgi:hypothetical protein